MTRTWLFVDAATAFGGHEVMLLRWIEELQKDGSGVRPRLLARSGGRLHQLASDASRAAPLPEQGGAGALGRLMQRWQEALALRRAMKHERPECVVFASGALGAQVPWVLLARLWGARVLVYVPLLDTFVAMGYRAGWIKDLFVRALYSAVPQGWVAISAGQAAHFRDWARPRGPVHVLPNTVAREIEDAPRIVPRELAADEPLRVLVLGRMDAQQKGLDFLLDHLEATLPQGPGGFHLSLVGEGPYRGIIEARCAANPALARCVTVGSWMPAREALAANDVLFMPSRFEGVPLVMLEAMALGVPVVGSDLPGVRAHVAPEHLFPVGDMAQAFERLNALRARAARELAAAQGRAAYEAGASSGAFAAAVASLTQAARATSTTPREVEPLILH